MGLEIFLIFNGMKSMDRLKWEESYLKVRRNLKQREKRIKMFVLDKNSCILELGCGDGLNLKILQTLGYKNIYGLDNSKELLSYISGIQTILADACNTGLPSDYFDVVFIDSLLHHLHTLEECLKEIRRILKPGGNLCVMEPRPSLIRKIFDLVTLSPLSNLSPFLKNRNISLKEEYDVYVHWLKTEHKLASYLDKYGFKIVFWKKGLIGMFVKCRLIKEHY